MSLFSFGIRPVVGRGCAARRSGQALKAVFATAFVFGLIGLGVAGIGALRGVVDPIASRRKLKLTRTKKLEATEVQLDSELAVILRFMRTYVDANDSYSKSLAQAHKNLPSLAQARAGAHDGQVPDRRKREDAARHRRPATTTSNTPRRRSRSCAGIWPRRRSSGLRDPLTALSNRRCFDINLAKEIAEAHAHGTAMCLVMGDIDRFKAINDTFGHQIGDEILKMFAKLLSSNVKGRDTVARFGGEEFAIILPETRLDDAEHLTETIRSQLEAKELAVNNSGRRSARSRPRSAWPQLAERDDADTLVQRADARLYEAKCAGRNRVVIDRPVAA